MGLIIRNLSKKFDEKTIFENFSYEFAENGLYAVSGESGKGKTTLLRMISGLDNDFKGEIVGGGFKNVSLAFQEYRLFPFLSALENLTEATGVSEAEASALLLKLGFYENDVRLRPRELSGGMKQRVSLARAFLKPSPILLLDEPTKELDADLKSSLYELIKKESEKRLVIFVSHSKEDIEALSPTLIKI